MKITFYQIPSKRINHINMGCGVTSIDIYVDRFIEISDIFIKDKKTKYFLNMSKISSVIIEDEKISITCDGETYYIYTNNIDQDYQQLIDELKR